MTINFSEFPVGTVITDQYAPDGIVFAGNNSEDQQVITSDSANPDSPELSGTPRFAGDVGGHFVVPNTTTRATVSSFSLDVGYINEPGSTLVEAFNRDDKVVARVYADEVGWDHLTVAHPGISRFLVESVSYENGGFGVDNVSFSPANQYAALGDSYASGEGSFSYLASSNTKDNRCHRAKSGYAETLSAELGLRSALRFAACSGDVIADLFSENTTVAAHYEPEKGQVTPDGGDMGEPPQVSVLNTHTRLVTLSIGGNDSGFVPVVTDCISGAFAPGAFGCASRDRNAVSRNLSYLVHGRPGRCIAWLPDARSPVDTWKFCQGEPSLEQTYEDIAADAPNAVIYVVGYPRLFGTQFVKGVCHVASVTPAVHYSIDAADVRWINKETGDLDTIIMHAVTGAAAATGRQIHFVDPRPAFAGHGLCGSRAPWINPLLLHFKTPRNESLHPNVVGQSQLENLLYTAIRKDGE